MGGALLWRRVHGWLTIAWAIQFSLAFWIFSDLQRSVPYLVGISIAAALLGEMSSWHAVRVEVKMEERGGRD
jgi:hypothetical protein